MCDFKAKSQEWGMPWTSSRGAAVTDMAARLDLTVLNTGNTTTFRGSGQRGTFIDVSFATTKTAVLTRRWRVLKAFTGSDHQCIEM